MTLVRITHKLQIHVNNNNTQMIIYKYWHKLAVTRISIKIMTYSNNSGLQKSLEQEWSFSQRATPGIWELFAQSKRICRTPLSQKFSRRPRHSEHDLDGGSGIAQWPLPKEYHSSPRTPPHYNSYNTACSICHVLDCKKGGLVTAHHNNLHYGFANLSGKAFTPSHVCDDPIIDPGHVVRKRKALPKGSLLRNMPVEK